MGQFSEEEQNAIAGQHLLARLQKFVGHDYTQGNQDDMRRVIKQHRMECKLRGVKFPEVTAFIFRTVGGKPQTIVHIVRADCSEQAIATHLHNLMVEFPELTAMELAVGLRTAFPDYNPNKFDIGREGKHLIQTRGLVQ